ncbi:unnamed protein product, partial [Urochloa humidicola]
LGSTQTVDMEMTRKNDFGRVYVAVLNPLLIPAKLDVVIGDHYFELEFKVERKGVDENGEEVEFNWTGLTGGEETFEGQEEDSSQENLSCGRETKRLRWSEKSFENKKNRQSKEAWGVDGLKNLVQNMTTEEFSNFLAVQAKEILDIAVCRNLEEVADKVLAEDDGVLAMTEEEEGGTSNIKKASIAEKKGKIKDMREEVAIPEAVLSPARSSPRLVNALDEHTMSKAERRAAERNLEHVEGHIQRDILDKDMGNVI